MDTNPLNSDDISSHLPRGDVRASQFRLRRARAFVNRKLELDQVASKVELLARGGVVHECVSNMSGVPGIGKSALLGKIADVWRASAQVRVLEIDMAQIYPSRQIGHDSVNEVLWREPITSPRLHFLQSIVRWLVLPADDLRDTFFDQVDHLTPESSDEAFDSALSMMGELLAASAQPLLLIIDSWDVAPDVLPPWFERVFLLPLVNRNCVLAIFGSQVVMRWWQFEIRRRALSHTLDPLKKEESVRQIGCPPDQTDLMYSFTYGYPLANEYLHDELPQFNTQHALFEAQPQIMSGILERVQSRVLAQISEELDRVLQIMTLFREFDVSTLRAILPQFYGEFELRSQSSLMMSLKELLATRLVSWNEQLRAYQFEYTIRRIYVKAMRVTHGSLYEEVREAALNYYSNLIDEDHEGRTIYLIEYCYHALYKYADNFYNEIHTLRTSLVSLFKRVYKTRNGQVVDSDRLQDMVHRLETDAEIQDALAELHVPHDWFTQLVAELGDTSPDG